MPMLPETARARLSHALWLLPPLLALLPHLEGLPPWLGLTCLGLWLWRLLLVLADRPLPARWLRIGLALVALAGVLAQFGSIVGQRAGVPLFILLLFIKLLESASLAEKRLLLILTQFMAMSYFLTAQSLPVTAYLLLVSVLGVAVMAHLQSGARLPPRQAVRRALGLFAAGLPLALLLFVFFPRLDRPLWFLPQQQGTASTGMSDTMGPGDIANLIQSGEIAFRVRFAGPVPERTGLYWRGPVLARFDGRTWHAIDRRQPLRGEVLTLGAPQRLTLTLEPHQRQWLFSLGVPHPTPEGTRLAAGLQWTSDTPVEQRRRWDLETYPAFRHLSPADALADALILPQGFNPRARELARRWRAAAPDPEAVSRAALALFHDAFAYTLEPPQLGPHSVDDFLFRSRRGFCEHFAGSYVFLMRAAGIPARVVTGYLGGEINPLDGHVVVRQSDAHAWAEIWLGPEKGWTRVDPTASVSPSRVEQGIGAALPAAEMPPALARLSVPWLQGMRHTWEMLNNGWNQWVLGYGQEQQLRLLARLSPDFASTRWLASATILAGTLGLGLLVWLYWRSGPAARTDPAARAWKDLERRLGKAGLPPCQAGEAPMDYARRVGRARPRLAAELGAIAELYLLVRYADAWDRLVELRRRIARFRVLD